MQSKVNASRDAALCGLRVEIILLPTTSTAIATVLLTITTSSMVLAQDAKQS